MKIKLLPSHIGPDSQLQLLTSFVIDDCVALDAGAIGLALNAHEIERIRNIVLTHAHLDHIATLPIFIDEAFGRLTSPLLIHALPEVIENLRQFIFNDRIWPNFEKIMLLNRTGPAVEFVPLEPDRQITVAALRVTPIPVNHSVPAVGLLVEDGRGAIIYTSDTYWTDGIWEAANRTEGLKAIFVDLSYPNELETLAASSRHLTPRSLGAELQKLKRETEIHCVHIKATHRAAVLQQLAALRNPHIHVAEIGRTYEW